MTILENEPEAKEICVKRVYPQRFAAELGGAKYDEFVRSYNEAVAASR